jgi:glycosyltransferase involved in cell wall biosynthesis
VQLTTGLSRSAGGPYFSVSELARAVCEAGHATTVLGVVGERGEWEADSRQWQGLEVQAVDRAGAATVARLTSQLRARLESGCSLVHAHGLWDSGSIACRLALPGSEVPFVLSPRGMLEPWALQYHAWKKRLARIAWQDAVLARVSMFHATSDAEARSIRGLGLSQPIAVIPNGVRAPARLEAGRRDSGPRRCVFLSRLHPKKGIPLLLEAWEAVAPAGWELVIAGYGEPAHVQEVEAAVGRVRQPGVSLIGELRDAEKWRFLTTADLFVLPSHSENFGIAVAEAIAAGLPVITTTATPWQVLQDQELGWWVPPTGASIATALAEAVSMERSELAARGARAAEHVGRHLSWRAIGERMVACYDWLLGHGSLPRDIRIASA